MRQVVFGRIFAHEAAERIKDQWFNAEDVYDDVRDVIGDPKIDDFQLPEAIERRLAETLKLEEEQRIWQNEIERLKESNMILEQQIEQLENDMQSSQPIRTISHKIICRN